MQSQQHKKRGRIFLSVYGGNRSWPGSPPENRASLCGRFVGKGRREKRREFGKNGTPDVKECAPGPSALKRLRFFGGTK
jgi:hypothetical protein